MNKKLLAVIGFMVLVCGCAFASDIGYSTVHSGFWWSVLSILLLLPACGLGAGMILLLLGDSEDLNIGGSIGIITGICGIFLGYQMFPTVWCGAIGVILGLFTSYPLFYCSLTKRFPDDAYDYICSYAFAILIFAFTVSVEAFAFVFLPDDWWLWKYFAIAGIGSGCGFVVSLAIHRMDKRLPIWLVSLMIPEFIAFWIVFANCGMNLAAAILLIIFAVLLFLTLVSPLILRFVAPRLFPNFVLSSTRRQLKEDAEKEQKRKEAEKLKAEKAAEEERKQKEEREIYIRAKAEADAKEESKQRQREFNRIMKEVCPGTDGHPNPSGEHDFSGGNFCKFCGKRLH